MGFTTEFDGFCGLSENCCSIADDVSFGVGLGIPYGGIGLNINYQINDTFDVIAGAGIGFGAGVRYHPFESNRKFRLTGYYGTYGFILEPDTDELETFSGLSFGVGYGSLSDGWDFDLIFIQDTGDIDDRINEFEAQGYEVTGDSGKVKISFGYHW